jgi:hypothetical protein
MRLQPILFVLADVLPAFAIDWNALGRISKTQTVTVPLRNGRHGGYFDAHQSRRTPFSKPRSA